MLAVTLGDPYSINIEMIGKLIQTISSSYRPEIGPVIIIGSKWQWRDQLNKLGFNEPSSLAIDSIADIAIDRQTDNASESKILFYDIGGQQASAEKLTEFQKGEIAVKSLLAVSDLSGLAKKMGNQKLAVLTAPIDKYSCTSAGFDFPGQTEFFQKIWDQEGVMLLAGPKLKVGLVTNHVQLKNVESQITPDLIQRKILALELSLKKNYGIKTPRIAVCGLNPHCGDHGLFGSFDDEVVAPAIVDYSHDSIVSGPLPADTVFWNALQGHFDAVLAMYHDQGLGPLKTVHFDDAINLTGGLKHLRVSPDHGPAKDRYLQKNASDRSFKEAFRVVNNYLSK